MKKLIVVMALMAAGTFAHATEVFPETNLSAAANLMVSACEAQRHSIPLDMVENAVKNGQPSKEMQKVLVEGVRSGYSFAEKNPMVDCKQIFIITIDDLVKKSII